MQEYILLCLIITCAGFIQGLSGFGSILISLPCLILFIPIKIVVPLVNLISCCINLILIMQMRHHLKWLKIIFILLAALPGIPLGAYILKTVETWILELILGIVLAGFAFYYHYSEPHKWRLHSGWACVVGFFSGCLGGSLGAYGPPIIIYSALQPWTKDEMKAFIVGTFFPISLGVFGAHAFNGLITKHVLLMFAGSLPFLIVGVLCGSLSYNRIAAERYKAIIAALLLSLGLLLITKAILW
jgi:uncharacterized membrane protein YfcA